MLFASSPPVKLQAAKPRFTAQGDMMKDEYDFSQSRKNPYTKRLKKQITIRVDEEVIEYFKNLSEDTDIPYQSLINFYLRDCATTNRRLNFQWE